MRLLGCPLCLLGGLLCLLGGLLCHCRPGVPIRSHKLPPRSDALPTLCELQLEFSMDAAGASVAPAILSCFNDLPAEGI